MKRTKKVARNAGANGKSVAAKNVKTKASTKKIWS